MAINVGTLEALLTLKDAMSPALKGAAATAAAAGASIAASMTAVGAAALAATVHLVNVGSELTDMAAKTSLSVKALQTFKAQGAAVGVSLDTIAQSALLMQRNLVNAPATFAALNMSVSALKAMKPEEAFQAVAERIGQIPDPAGRAAAAMDAFGRGGLALLPLITSNMAGTAEAAQRLGYIMSDEVVAAADDLGDSVTVMAATWEGFTNNVAAAVVTSEPLHTLINGLIDVLGQLSGKTSDNQATLRSFVDGGVVIAAKALVGLADVAQMGIDSWDALRLTWASATSIAAGLGIALNKLFLATHMDTSAAERAGFEENIRLLEGMKVAAAADAVAIVQANATKTESIGKMKAVLVGLEAAVEASVGKTHVATVANVAHGESYHKVAEGAKAATAALYENKKAVDAFFESMEDAPGLSPGGVPFDLPPDILGVGYTATEEELARARAQQNAVAAHGLGAGVVTKEAQDAIDKAAAATKAAWIGAAIEIGQVFTQLGAEIGGIAGGLLSVLGRVGSVIDNYKSAVGPGSTKAGKIQAGVAAAGGALDIYNANRQNLSGANAALSGAASGAALGAAFGPIGIAVGAIAGGLIGFFSGSKFRGIAKDAGKTLGVELSKESVQAIEKSMKDLHITAPAAALLHITDAMSDSGKAAGSFAPQVLALMDGIKDGSIPAKEGLEQLGAAFSAIKDEAMKAGAVGNAALSQILNAARAGGQLTDEMTGFISEQNAKVTSGMNDVIAGLDPANLGAAQGALFGDAFWAEVADKGLVGANDALGGSFKKLTEAGVVLPPDVTALFDLMGREDGLFKGAATAGQGLKSMMEGIAAQGLLTASSMANMGTSAQAAFDQAIQGGAGEKEALAAIMPYLKTAVDASTAQGVALDANTQKLVDQATAQGFAFPTAPIEKVVDLLSVLVLKAGGELPESVTRGATSLEALAPAAEAGMSGAVAVFDSAGAQIVNSMAAASSTVSGDLTASIVTAADAFTSVLGEGSTTAADTMTGTMQTAAESIASILGAITVPPITVPYTLSGGMTFNKDGSPDYDHNPLNSFAGGLGPGVLARDFFGPVAFHKGERIEVTKASDTPARMAGGGSRVSVGDIHVYPSPGMNEQDLAEKISRVLRDNTGGAADEVRRRSRT